MSSTWRNNTDSGTTSISRLRGEPGGDMSPITPTLSGSVSHTRLRTGEWWSLQSKMGRFVSSKIADLGRDVTEILRWESG